MWYLVWAWKSKGLFSAKRVYFNVVKVRGISKGGEVGRLNGDNNSLYFSPLFLFLNGADVTEYHLSVKEKYWGENGTGQNPSLLNFQIFFFTSTSVFSTRPSFWWKKNVDIWHLTSKGSETTPVHYCTVHSTDGWQRNDRISL